MAPDPPEPPVRILLVSDIHGNFPALAAVAAHPAAAACTMVFNCGDSTVYAPFADQTLAWLRGRDAVSILGNTDRKVLKLLRGKTFRKPRKPEKRIMYEDTAGRLSPAGRSYLQGLKKKKKLEIAGHRIGLFHGSPEDHDEFLFADTPEQRFLELAGRTDRDIIVTGHSHSPYHRLTGGVHFINPGSVGRMFDGNPDASFAVLTLAPGKITVRHFRTPYAIDQVVAGLARHDLPPVYATMYRQGRKLN